MSGFNEMQPITASFYYKIKGTTWKITHDKLMIFDEIQDKAANTQAVSETDSGVDFQT